MGIFHQYVSAIPDGGDTDVVQPSDWNAVHSGTNEHTHADTDNGGLLAGYAVAAKGVTNGDTHDHNGGDGAQIDHVNLANKGTNTHSAIDSFISSKAAANGLASLNASTLVVENPANATATPTASKIPISDTDGYLIDWLPREILLANRTYYIRTDGDDANTGLADSTGGAKLTLQGGLDALNLIDFNGYTVTLQFAAGTYAGASLFPNTVGQKNPNDLIIQGDTSTPSNVVLSTTADFGVTITMSGRMCMATIKGVKIQATGTSGLGLWVTSGSECRISDLDFGACPFAHIEVDLGAIIYAQGNYTISGDAGNHLYVAQNGIWNSYGGITVTASGSRAFTAFVKCDQAGVVLEYGTTYSGTFTGSRFLVDTGGVIYPLAGSLTYFPGNAAGTVTAAGMYYVGSGVPYLDPANAKFWVRATANSTTIQQSYNVTSVEDTATGRMTVNIATDFAAATWAGHVTLEVNNANSAVLVPSFDAGSIAAGTCIIESWLTGTTTEALTDPTSWCVIGYGSQI